MLTAVIIPCYNAEKWIERAIRSALAQTAPVRIICIDDASTDATADVILRLRAEDSRVLLLRHSSNRRQGAALNTGLGYVRDMNSYDKSWSISRYSYVAFLDADDLWEPTKVEECIRVMEGNPAAVMAYTNGWQIGPSDERYQALMPTGHEPPTSDQLLLNPEMSPSQVLLPVNIAVRTLFKESLVPNDHDIFLRLREMGEFAYVDAKLSHYRRHPAQMSASRGMWEGGWRVLWDTWCRSRERYRSVTFIRRAAVLMYRLGEHDRNQGRHLRWLARWGAAAMLDPARALRTVLAAPQPEGSRP